ncbi:hypothetical protein LJC05_03595 [Bacteroides sp. OttesenSCG-928-J23]|nr:hypothetical protein [Bacteroides sp. OttesenSCG-928-J23]
MNRIQCTIDNAQLTITAAIIILLFAACTNADDEATLTPTPITIGKLQVAGDGEADTRAVGDWTPQYEAFNDGDEMKVKIYTMGNPPTLIATTTYQYQAPGNWALASGATQLYKEDLPANIIAFTADKGNTSLTPDQSTFANYCAADYINGLLTLSGHELVNKDGTTLTHEYVDVVINIIPVSDGGHWDGVDFMALMRQDDTKVRFLHTGTGDPITPFLATLTPQMATYRAVIPTIALPIATTTEAKNIITITSKGAAPVTGKYTLDVAESLTASNAAGKRLTIDIKYDNKRTLTGTATVSTWTTGPEYEVCYNGYMVINSAQSLKAFRDLVNAGNTTLKAVQTADIDLKGEAWVPIGITDLTNPFQGVYNGGGHTISGLNVEGGDDSFQGLFGVTQGAILTGIKLIEPSVTGGSFVGALVGRADGGTHISNCSVQGATITGGSYIGGLVGGSRDTVVSCSATGVTVTATGSYAGGLAGDNAGTIAFCHAAGVVKGGNPGALVGRNYSTANIYSCYATIPTGSDATALVGDERNPTNPATTEANKNSIAANPGDIVRAYVGTIEVNTDKYSIRKVDAGIWGAGDKPELVW